MLICLLCLTLSVHRALESVADRQTCCRGHCCFCHSKEFFQTLESGLPHNVPAGPPASNSQTLRHAHTHTHSAITAACWNFLGLLVMRHLFSVPPAEDSVSLQTHTVWGHMSQGLCIRRRHMCTVRSVDKEHESCKGQLRQSDEASRVCQCTLYESQLLSCFVALLVKGSIPAYSFATWL